MKFEGKHECVSHRPWYMVRRLIGCRTRTSLSFGTDSRRSIVFIMISDWVTNASSSFVACARSTRDQKCLFQRLLRRHPQLRGLLEDLLDGCLACPRKGIDGRLKLDIDELTSS